MKVVTLKDGFSVELRENCMDNMEMIDALSEMTSDEDALAISKVCKLLMDDKQRKELYNHLREDDGRVPVAGIGAAIKQIFDSFAGKEKN